MALDPQLVGAAQVLAGLVSLGFLKPVFANWDTAGSRSFGLFVIGTALWMFGLGGSNFTSAYALSITSFKIAMLGSETVAAAWLLLALEVTERESTARRISPVLGGALLLIQLLIWTNPFHHFVFGAESHVDGVLLSFTYGPGFWVHVGIAYLSGLTGTVLLLFEGIRSVGIRRKQALLFAGASVPVFLADLLSLFEVLQTPYDITPFGYLLAEVGLVLVLYRGRFLDITPVARRTAMAEMADAMVTLDAEDQVVDANRKARQLFDVDEEYVGMPAAEFFGPVPQDVLDQFADTRQANTEITVELDGQQRQFSLSISPVGTQTTRGRVVLLHDITAQKRREQELERQNERLDQFASMVSHDLRNPLGVVESYTDFAEETGDPADFEAIREATERMDAMIDDLLTLAKSGQTVKTTEQVALADVASEAWDNVNVSGCELELVVPTATTIEADPDRLLHVFENLFRNAADHNDPPITVFVKPLQEAAIDADDGSKSGFVVEDDGVGISEDERNAIFEHGYTTSDDGTGFGLSIVKDIIEAHGWEIRATDRPNGGARFEIVGCDTNDGLNQLK